MTEPSKTPLTDAFERKLYAEDSCLVTEPTFPDMLAFARSLELRFSDGNAENERLIAARRSVSAYAMPLRAAAGLVLDAWHKGSPMDEPLEALQEAFHRPLPEAQK